MSDTSKPVWVWRPGEVSPIECGRFDLVNGVGLFSYREDYVHSATKSVALDPIHLPVTHRSRPFKETLQEGLFGVIRDAKPEGYGLDLLAMSREVRADDPMHVLEKSVGDTIGAIEVCDDIEAKLAYLAPESEQLLHILAQLPEARPASEAIRTVMGVPGTSAGGERPKLTVMHDGQYWLAKLQDRGDRPNAPLREFVAMRVARRCGVNSADVEFKLVGGRQVILVRRFDRDITPDGLTTRRLYASAHTVLHLDRQPAGSRERSYIGLSKELQRWCGQSEGQSYRGMQRELWRRVVLNSILGNGDDHPRNTGLLFEDGQWMLSPAFDIAPHGSGFAGVQRMNVSRSQTSPASSAIFNLLADVKDYSYEEEEAREFIAQTCERAPQIWRAEAAAQGFSEVDLPFQDPVWLDAPEPPRATTSSRARGQAR